ncbi:MAG: hypothetical protein IKU72_03765 [Oscillospiraceae bacterium]|nr:hypothetical protein [Oscillospiraceae bacterium]
METYIIGIDIGTTGTKCSIFDLQGNTISKSYREYKSTYPLPMWAEQNPDMLVRAMTGACNEAITKSGLPSSAIRCLGISCQRCCAVFLDKHGKALMMISWQDSRATEQAKQIAQAIDMDEYYHITGHPISSTWILPKLMWVRDNNPKLMEETDKVVQLQDYVLKQLGADDYYTPSTDAQYYGVWNIKEQKIEERYANLFGFNEFGTPKIRQPGYRVGYISAATAEKTGLGKGIPLFVGAGDQSCAALGAGTINHGDICVSMGTGGMCMVCSDHYMEDPEYGFYNSRHIVSDKWQWEGMQKGSASIFKWFKNELAALETEQSRNNNTDVYTQLNKMVVDTPIGSKGLLLLPFFAGSTPPHWNPEARGAFIGLTLAHDRGCLARACMEGITMEQREMLEYVQTMGIKANRVRVVGGPTKSEVWNQIQADIYGIPVESLAVTDASVLGAAIIGAVGAGIFPDYPSAVESLVKVSKEYIPNPAAVEMYNQLFDVYKQAYRDLCQGTFSKLSKIQSMF